jgi:hypothetical protein
MAWGGIDLIPVRDGETPQDAVDRVYEGGVVHKISLVDGVPSWTMEALPGGKDDPEFISRAERAWMLHALDLLEELEPGWTVDHQEKGEHRRWPYELQAVHEDFPLWVCINDSYASLKGLERWPGRHGEWPSFWRVARHFAQAGNCAIFYPDTSEMLDGTLDADEARAAYCIM